MPAGILTCSLSLTNTLTNNRLNWSGCAGSGGLQPSLSSSEQDFRDVKEVWGPGSSNYGTSGPTWGVRLELGGCGVCWSCGHGTSRPKRFATGATLRGTIRRGGRLTRTDAKPYDAKSHDTSSWIPWVGTGCRQESRPPFQLVLEATLRRRTHDYHCAANMGRRLIAELSY